MHFPIRKKMMVGNYCLTAKLQRDGTAMVNLLQAVPGRCRMGSLFLDTTIKDGGDLTTDDEFGNFDLKLDWNISKNGNSGIIFYVHEDTTKYKQTWHTGLEMQVLDNGGHPDAKIPKHRAGDLYDLISSSPETVKPVGEWNQVEIISNNGQLEFHLNGTKVLSTTLWDDNWKKLVVHSKFKTMPGFSTFKTGKISFAGSWK